MSSEGLKPADRVRVIANGSGHNRAIGENYILRAKHGVHGWYVVGLGAYFMFTDLELASYTKAYAEEEIDKLEEEIRDKEERMGYLEEVISMLLQEDKEEVLPAEFTDYRLAKILEDDEHNNEEKTAMISRLFKEE